MNEPQPSYVFEMSATIGALRETSKKMWCATTSRHLHRRIDGRCAGDRNPIGPFQEWDLKIADRLASHECELICESNEVQAPSLKLVFDSEGKLKNSRM
jgi:hypothetical protein